MQEKISCSIGVFAYNEEQNIGKLLTALEKQQCSKVEITEVIVVSSASTDKTDEIVRKRMENNSKLHLITESQRNGKSAAINKFLEQATGEALIIESADTIPDNDVVEKLVSPFLESDIGMSGGRPVPVNSEKSLLGYTVCLLWRLHHRLALKSPKLGEMVAFKNVVKSIPVESAVDEASIEAEVRKNNLKKIYIPDAIIHNKGPETFADFFKQRRRIAAGHYWLKQTSGYNVSSSDNNLLLKITLEELKSRPAKTFHLVFAMGLEVLGRFLGWFDFHIKKKNPFKWDIAKSTKNLETRK